MLPPTLEASLPVTCPAMIAIQLPCPSPWNKKAFPGVKWNMRAYNSALLLPLLAVTLSGCGDAMHPRPSNVSSAAVWVDHVFIDCSVGTPSNANHCTVYKDGTGEILADGLFTLNSSHFAAA